MNTEHKGPLIPQLLEEARLQRPGRNVLVALDDPGVFHLLASEMARLAADDPGTAMFAAVDPLTAAQVDTVEALAEAADRALVLGEAPPGRERTARLEYAGAVAGMLPSERFLAVISSTVSMAVVGIEMPGPDSRPVPPAAFRGYWTTHRSAVRGIIERVLAATGAEPGPLTAVRPSPQALEKTMACAMHLMSLFADRLESLQRDMAMDKDELVSVLDILKAISVKRRAHDILYVFVERIARVIRTDRCSVVRVRSDRSEGYVLASHEDEGVNELRIDLERYPELTRSMETREKVVINGVRHDPLMRRSVREYGADRFSALLVVPIVLYDQSVGSLFLRAARIQGSFDLREISFCEIAAGAAANALERAHLFEGIQLANERLERLAVTDGLTALYNHRYFRERLEEEFDRARRYGNPLACIMLDIDNFKQVNDTHGHLVGDAVLKEMAARAMRTVRKSDLVARYGGEEFVILLPQTGAEGASAEAERLRKVLGEGGYAGTSQGERITVSLGVAVYEDDGMEDCEQLVRAADSALYQAKRQGKNRVVLASAEREDTEQ